MKRGRSIVVAAALAVGIVAGWGVGAARGTCEHTCPAQGPCPTPVDCLSHPFNWAAAIVLGFVVTAVIVAVGIAMLNANRCATASIGALPCPIGRKWHGDAPTLQGDDAVRGG